MKDLLKTIHDHLQEWEIEFEQVEHPPLFTCDDANQWIPHLEGAPTKNLFLRDRKKKRHFLVAVHDEKTVNLKQLSALFEVNNLSFASAESLKQYLGIEPGAVSLLALTNDLEKKVEVFIDQDLWSWPSLQCHPHINTKTCVISIEGIETFLEKTGHVWKFLQVPR